jgi:N-acetylglutamate synthase-like GNAT family acetyltransferase
MSFEVSTDKARLDLELIHRFLSESYWAKGIPFETVKRSIDGSICFGIYLEKKQIGFARVISDCATFAYLADVFVLDGHRGQGASKLLMQHVLAHSELQGLRRWFLMTRDAHGLYKRYGFAPLPNPDRAMEINDREIYSKAR